MTVVLSNGGPTVYSSESPSTEVLVGTAQGIVTLQRGDHGSEWHVSQRSLTDRHISAIVVEPESSLIFAAAFHGSVHASSDGGKSWEPRDNGLTETNVYSLAPARVSGKVRLYLGTEPARLFYSDDLGRQWAELPSLRAVPSVGQWTFPAPPHIGHLKHIDFDPFDSNTIYASIEVGALLRSVDGGQTWVELGIPDRDAHRTVIPPTTPGKIYLVAGGDRPGGNGVYVSHDGGANWKRLTDSDSQVGGYPDLLVVRPSQPELMFLGAAYENPDRWRVTHFAGARISRSNDGGRTWEVLRGGLPDRLQASIEAMCLEDWGPSFSVFAATTGGEVYCSEDGGDHWAKIISGLAPISKGHHYQLLATV